MFRLCYCLKLLPPAFFVSANLVIGFRFLLQFDVFHEYGDVTKETVVRLTEKYLDVQPRGGACRLLTEIPHRYCACAGPPKEKNREIVDQTIDGGWLSVHRRGSTK